MPDVGRLRVVARLARKLSRVQVVRTSSLQCEAFILSWEGVAIAIRRGPVYVCQRVGSHSETRNVRPRMGAQKRTTIWARNRQHPLVLFAFVVHGADDSFVEVKMMFKDMVVRLMEEATEEIECKI